MIVLTSSNQQPWQCFCKIARHVSVLDLIICYSVLMQWFEISDFYLTALFIYESDQTDCAMFHFAWAAILNKHSIRGTIVYNSLSTKIIVYLFLIKKCKQLRKSNQRRQAMWCVLRNWNQCLYFFYLVNIFRLVTIYIWSQVKPI